MATASAEIKVTPEIAAEHGVTRDEYARIQQILGRDPNITELGIFSVMWSEHCSYKSSKVHLKRLPTRGKLVVQGPGENAGVVDIGDGLVAAFRSNRTITRVTSSRFKARRPVWAESYATFSPCERGRLRCSIRSALEKSRPAREPASRTPPPTAGFSMASFAASRITETVLACPPSAGKLALSPATRRIRS